MLRPLIEPERQLARLLQVPHEHPWGWDRLPRGTEEHQTLRASAVLILAKPVDGDDVAFLLVRRSRTSRYHAGEFAFPGGGIEPGESPAAAALRECHEESGVLLGPQQVLGTLPALALLASGNLVTPVLAWLGDSCHDEYPNHWKGHEIESSHWVTRRSLVDPATRTTVVHREEWTGPGFPLADGYVWGFTAKVLDWLLHESGWDQPWDEARRHILSA
jgi:8-oxo-dGTP pyrophosphatase MutT (NUDIX family)